MNAFSTTLPAAAVPATGPAAAGLTGTPTGAPTGTTTAPPVTVTTARDQRGISIAPEVPTAATVGRLPDGVPCAIEVEELAFHYGRQQALWNNSIRIPANRVTAIIGPSGCGKSTHLRCYNRIFELYRDQKASGRILLHGANLLDPSMDLIELRRRIGMIFQKPTPFPMSIFENVAYGLRLHYRLNRSDLADRVQHALERAALWPEVKDKLGHPGPALSGGQQQRLCIARAIAVEPEVLLMDEPTSAIDPVATSRIEDLVHDLKSQYTIVIVTHNMQQAARISDFTAFFYSGHIVEFGATERLFTKPEVKQTEDYITGRFG